MHLKESANAPDTLERNANAFLALSSEAGPILEEPIQSAISHTRCQAADPVIARFRAILNEHSDQRTRAALRTPASIGRSFKGGHPTIRRLPDL